MYSDPSGEIIWFVVAAAIIGGYTAGVKANGSWNPFKWNWKATGLKILTGALVGAVSGATGAWVGQAAAVFAASWGISGGILGGAIAGFAGGAVAGAVSGLGNAAIFGENIGRGIIAGVISGAIGGAVIGGTVGGIQQGLANAKVTTTGIGAKGNIWTGNAVAPGRSVWALNNTPNTTTVGKVGRLEVGQLKGEIIRSDYNPYLNDNINSNPEVLKPINFGKSYGKLGKVAVKPNMEISGFKPHGINQVINRGVEPANIMKTINNPNIVLQQTRGYLYLSRHTAVVVNFNGKIVTVYPSSMFDDNIWSILNGH